MKLMVKAGVVGAALIAAAAPAYAQNSNVAEAQASTDIVRPVTIGKDSDLAFGRVARPRDGQADSVITLTTGGSISATGTAALLGGHSVGGFTIRGDGGQTVSVTVPTSIAMNNGDNTISVTPAYNIPVTAGQAQVQLSNSTGSEGTSTLLVGGSMTVSSGTALGAYSGNFQVTVNYN